MRPVDLVPADRRLELEARLQLRLVEATSIVNMICLAATAITVLGLYAMGAGSFALCGFLMLFGVRNIEIGRLW